MKEDIRQRFEANLNRVQALMDAYASSTTGPGRRAVGTTDILRAAVVFLHATLEDLVRSLLEWKLPHAPASHLSDTPLVGKMPRSRYTLDDLAAFRGSTVDDVIARSVGASLERSNFNDPGEIDAALEQIQIPSGALDPSVLNLVP